MGSCKECYHYEVCRMHYRQKCELTYETEKEVRRAMLKAEKGSPICDHFKDRSRFVELPCKVGDSVFTIDKKEKIQECIVINVNCKTQMTLDKKLWIDFIIVTEPVDDSIPFPMIFTYSITKNQILFLTKESAEQALKERKK